MERLELFEPAQCFGNTCEFCLIFEVPVRDCLLVQCVVEVP